MEKTKNRFLKDIFKLAEKELLAILTVAVVLVLVFSQAQAESLGIPESPLPTYSANQQVTIQSLENSDTLFNNQEIIYFGLDVQGKNNANEQWVNIDNVANFGDSIFVTDSAELTLNGVNDGIWGLYVTGMGKVYLNGVDYYFGKYQGTRGRQIIVRDNTLRVKFENDSQVWSISSYNPGAYNYIDILEAEDYQQIPRGIDLIPEEYTLNIGNSFNPVAFVHDQKKKVVKDVSITWGSSNSSIATVNDKGEVTAINPGVATISAQVSGTNLKSSMTVTIK